MATQSIYNKVFYQTFDLHRNPLSSILPVENYTINSGVNGANPFEEIEVFINKNYNLVEGFFFDYPNELGYGNLLVDVFQIDDLEILPYSFPIELFKTTTSTPFNKKFVPLNVPIRQGKLKIRLRSMVGVPPISDKVNLVFKLKNVDNDAIYYKDFFKYQVEKIASEPGDGSGIDLVHKKEFRVKYTSPKLVGIATKMISYPPLVAPSQVGLLKVQINSKKSVPINVPVYEQITPNIKYQQEFITLDEQIENGSMLNTVLELHAPNAGFFTGSGIVIIVLKYSI